MLELDKSNIGGVLFQTKQNKDRSFIMLRCQKSTFKSAEKAIISFALCLNMRWANLQRNA